MKFLSVGALGSGLSNLLSFRKKTVEYIYSYVVPPVGVIPGVPNWYASVCRQCPAGCGIEVKIREGRAKKIEGNSHFPVNSGRVCGRGQASLQTLYNPDRIVGPKLRTEEGFEDISWNEALRKLADILDNARKSGQKDSVAFLTDPLRGNLSGLISTFFDKLGVGQLYSHGLFNDEALIAANKQCFDRAALPDYDIENTRFILSLGTEFMDTWASPVKHAVGYGRMRDRKTGIEGERGWLVQFEPRQSVTGASADEWHPIKPETEGILALGIANVIVDEKLNDPKVDAEIGAWKKALDDFDLETVSKKTGVDKKTIVKVAQDFAHASPAVAICGGAATAQANGGFNAVAANILNHLVGSVGREGGVRFPAPAFFSDRIEKDLSYKDLRELARRMSIREIDVVFINNTNPVFTLPESSGLKAGLEGVPVVVSLSNMMDETTALADLILPDAHFLESWGDYVPLVDPGNKTIGLMQPVVTKLDDSRPIGDVFLDLADMLGRDMAAALPAETFEQYLKDAWLDLYNDGRKRGLIQEDTFEKFWDVSLEKGGWWEEQSTQAKLGKRPKPGILKEVSYKKPVADGQHDFHLELYPSHGAYDGRGANQPWLQQMPEPLVTAAWGTWIEINPETAAKMEIEEGDVIKVTSSAGEIQAPAFIYPAIHPQTVAVPIGQGHSSYGRYAEGFGVNPLALMDDVDDLSGGLAWASTMVSVSKTTERQKVVKTDPLNNQPGMENGPREMDRHLVQWISPEEDENLVGHDEEEPILAMPTRDLRKAPHFLSSLGLARYRQSKYYEYEYRWGMVIDLDKCTGCGSCMVACTAENNLPITNAVEMGRGRHKNWIRVDRYWDGDYPEVRAKVLPINCYQCGNAPCEPVCPVYAAFHTVDGLNGQVYPRCIGTRYCNAACPYKARRFNWTKPEWPEPLNHQINTDVTVRFSGITEKCTFCVQRIRLAKDLAKDDDRRVEDGEIQPACAQTCPSGAVTFGDLADPTSEVSKLTKSYRRYRVLEELNTEPAVIYLKAVRVVGAEGAGEHGAETEEQGAEEGGGSDEH